jgi:hypothetical protein
VALGSEWEMSLTPVGFEYCAKQLTGGLAGDGWMVVAHLECGGG